MHQLLPTTGNSLAERDLPLCVRSGIYMQSTPSEIHAMTPKEAVIACCEHRPTDRIPVYHASISSRIASIVLGREAYVGGGIQQWREAVALWNGPEAHREFLERTKRDTLDLPKVLDDDMVRVTYWRMPEKPARRIDERTFFYGDPEGSWRVMRFDPDTELYQTIDWAPKDPPTEDDLEEELRMMEASLETFHPTAEDFPDILAGLEAWGSTRAIPGTGVYIGVQFRSQAWLEMVAARPDLVRRWLENQAERAVRSVEAQKDLDVQVMLGGGDLATYGGPMYSPKAFRELLLPNLRRIVDACHKHGKYYFFASDGNLWPIADDIFPVVDGYYEIDRRAGMDLRMLRERYPHLTLVGNISSHTLHLGTRQEVIDETLSCIEAAKEAGSIIVGCSNLIVCQTPPENFLAMIETLRDNR